jgi:hypothetical protein
MKLWMDVMRHLEPVVAHHERWFDAWAAAGVDGLVVGPLFFEEGQATFDPDPAAYRALGVEPPAPPVDPAPEKRRGLERMLAAARDRGWRVWLFQASAGAGPGGAPSFTDPRTRAAACARMVDTLRHYPQAHGAIMDGPEWGYEIAPGHMDHRSYLFHDLPETVAPACAALGYDYSRLAAARDRLAARLHALTPASVALAAEGGLLGAFQLFGSDPDLFSWLRFRVDSLTGYYQGVRECLDASLSPRPLLGVGPRSAAFAPLCGYDLPALARSSDVLLVKHYFWHRGFDGMYGTVCRWVETLVAWNPSLSDEQALAVVACLFGLRLPEVRDRADFDAGFPAAFFEQVVARETRAALAAVGDPERLVPWVDTGRKPHDGDPMPAGDLRRLLLAAQEAGLSRFLYHHHGNLSAGEWAVIAALCGKPWIPAPDGYVPPDLPVL